MAQGRPLSPQTSGNIRGTEGSDGDYLMMEELDEENINWGKLLTRAFCILLLLIIICCVSVCFIVFIYFLIFYQILSNSVKFSQIFTNSIINSYYFFTLIRLL